MEFVATLQQWPFARAQLQQYVKVHETYGSTATNAHGDCDDVRVMEVQRSYVYRFLVLDGAVI